MQVSTSSNVSIEWTPETKALIIQLTSLDEAQRIEKENIFQGLYALWKRYGLGTVALSKNEFVSNKGFIKESILRSLDFEKIKEIDITQKIFDTIRLGNDFSTPQGVIIPSTPEDIDYWNERRINHQRLINRKYNALFDQFNRFLMYRNDDKPQPIEYVPQLKITAERENPPRVAKDKLLPGNFKGMTTSESVGSKRKGKTGNTDEVKLSHNSCLILLTLFYALLSLKDFGDYKVDDVEPPQKQNDSQVVIKIIFIKL